MTDRTELLEAALDSLPDGVALFGAEGELVFWNQAAQGITGYAANDFEEQPLPQGLEPLFFEASWNGNSAGDAVLAEGRRALVRTRHKLGHGIAVITWVLVLRNALGERIGAAALFHPAECLDALPHGKTGEDMGVEESRAVLEERLLIAFDDFRRGGPPVGVLWIGVDQARELRKTHGASACHAMLEKVRRALAQGLRPAEEIGRWGDDEFLILAHERNAEMLAAHAQTLAGLARTADFRWWGDRISVTVSIGAAQAADGGGETLAQLLERARQAMDESHCAGGNRATSGAVSSPPSAAVEDATCLPS